MEYKKIIKNNYTLHLINTNRFKSISIVIFLIKKFKKSDIAYGSMLTKNMLYSSKKYNTKSKMTKIVEDLYGAKISASFGITGDTESFTFSLDFLNPKYTSGAYLNKTLNFFNEVLMNPNIENKEFNNTYFDLIKNDMISSIKSIKDNPRIFGSVEYAKIMYKGTSSSYSTYPELKEVKKITSKNLYEFYNTLFNGEYKIDIVVHGEYDNNIIKIIDEKFGNLKGNNKKLSFFIDHKYDSKEITKIDTLPFNQSRLYMGYRLYNLNYHELNHVLRIYNTILGTMNDSILFNVVREANSLCYSIGSYYSKYNPSLTIYAGINQKNYEKSVKLIKECIEMMKDKKEVERLFESAKKTINTYLNNYYDDLSAQINERYQSEFETLESIETLRENINKVTMDEVIELNSKIKLAVIYLVKGENSL